MRAHREVAAPAPSRGQQGPLADQFFYFFLRLRKGEIRRMVQRIQALYPGESPAQLARRLINAQSALSFLGGAILHLPHLFPTVGTVWKFAGFVGGTSLLTRMHLYLILEIALLYGHDIDDQARVPEMLAVVAATGLSAATPFMVSALEWNPSAAIPASALTASAVTRLIGEAAIRMYEQAALEPALA
ncbi:conserved protein of unknown function [Candidatus Methylocalor cossyra]|uniref:Uncharacterized protein n=2 Tax=Candidatus Methylocalor cossyra TaxID=3108543 RepID=A0ABP1C634_9GAMM